MTHPKTHPKTGDVYISNKGKGPYLADVLTVREGRVVMRLRTGKPREFELSEHFFASPACGWRLSQKFTDKDGNVLQYGLIIAPSHV